MYYEPKYELEVDKATDHDELQKFMASMRRHNERQRIAVSITRSLRQRIAVSITRSLIEALSTTSIYANENPKTLILRFQSLAYLMSHPTSSVRTKSEAGFLKLARIRYIPRELSLPLDVMKKMVETLGRRVADDNKINVRFLVLLDLRSSKNKDRIEVATKSYLALAEDHKFSFAVGEYTTRDFHNLGGLCEYADFSEDQRNKMFITILFLLATHQASPELTQCLGNLLKGGSNFSFFKNEFFEMAFAEYFSEGIRSWMNVQKARVLVHMSPMDDSLMEYLDHYHDEELAEPLMSYIESNSEEGIPCEERYQSVLLNVASRYSFKSRGRLALIKNLSWRVFGKFLDSGLPLYATKAIRGVDVELYQKYTSTEEQEVNCKILERYAKHWPELGREMEGRGLL